MFLGCGSSPGDDAGTEDATVAVCTSDDECADALACNGAERCDPNSASADDEGCVAGTPLVCAGGCDEAMGGCAPGCVDADGDSHEDAACGGDDCDDDDANRFPGNVETCGGADTHDEDCDDSTLGEDADRDGDGVPSDRCCNGDSCGTDCDDTDLTRRPGQLEICDSVDNDCDDTVDEEENSVPWYPDTDGDGFGDPDATPVNSCSPVLEHSIRPRDCDDTRASVSPVGVESCNGLDDDCDTDIDEGLMSCMPMADGGMPDAGPADAGPMDAGPMDAGPMDAGPMDAGCMPAVFGTSRFGASCFQ